MSGHIDLVVIGANDGVSHLPDDNLIIDSIHNKHMSALLVEPYGLSFERLKSNYGEVEGVTLERAAITTHNGHSDLYVPVGSRHPFVIHNYLCSVDRSFAEAAGRNYGGADIIIEKVPCLTFAGLMEKHGVLSIDTLLTDAEGHDADILLSINFDKVTIEQIYFESASTDGHGKRGVKFDRLIDYLRKHGFTRFKPMPENQFEHATTMADKKKLPPVWTG